jgi:plasmid stabilization system protein ParE
VSRFILSAEARVDYFEAFDFIANYSPRAALKWEAMMLDTFQHLAVWPQTGKIRPEYAPPYIRFWPAGDYVILYNPSSSPVEIIAIVHGARNLSELMAARIFEDDSETDPND